MTSHCTGTEQVKKTKIVIRKREETGFAAVAAAASE